MDPILFLIWVVGFKQCCFVNWWCLKGFVIRPRLRDWWDSVNANTIEVKVETEECFSFDLLSDCLGRYKTEREGPSFLVRFGTPNTKHFLARSPVDHMPRPWQEGRSAAEKLELSLAVVLLCGPLGFLTGNERLLLLTKIGFEGYRGKLLNVPQSPFFKLVVVNSQSSRAWICDALEVKCARRLCLFSLPSVYFCVATG